MSTPVSKSLAPPAERVSSELLNVLNSSGMRGSEPLRKLLSYLAEHSLENGGHPARESDIALAVFGRQDFDSKIDSVVRVQTGRLRSKLAEYYMSEGLQSDIVLEIPKGSYGLSPRWRTSLAEFTPALGERTGLRRKKMWIALAATGLAAILLIVASRLIPARATAVETFWKPLLQHPEDALVIFSNPRFTGTATTGLKLLDPAQPVPDWVNETYSGTGEVFAVQDLTRTLSFWHKNIALRRARLLVWEEARTRDLIFLGAPSQNSPTGELRLRHFTFQSEGGNTGFVNQHPQPGEPPVYLGSGPPYTSDYAVISQLPGFEPSHRALVLAGTTTYGTQAAAEFVCREDSLAELLARLGVKRGMPVPSFEALLQVRITGGVAIESRLTAVRIDK